MFSGAPYRLARLVPHSVRRFIHSHRGLDGLAMKAYGMLVGDAVVAVEDGPMRGVRLAASKNISHAHVAGTYEVEVMTAIADVLQPDWTCYDLGASVGYVTLLMASRTKQVFSFEPAPHASAELERQVAANDFRNVSLVRKPLSDRVQTVRFALTEAAYGSSIVDGETEWPVQELETTTLDLFAAEHPAPNFLKIDIEGAEGAALAGGRRTLEAHRPTICCEVHSASAWREVREVLEPLGYRLTTLQGDPAPESPGFSQGELHVMAWPRCSEFS